MTYRGRIENGVVVLEGAIRPPEGAEVEVEVRAVPGETSSAASSLKPAGDSLDQLIGQVQGLPGDASRQKRHYLYGHPKTS